MELKDTLFMGKTEFEMRGNLNNKEPKIQENWEKMDLYNKVIKKIDDVKDNDTIKLSLSDGNINALVISKEKK